MEGCFTFMSDEQMKKENPRLYEEIVKKRKEVLDRLGKEKAQKKHLGFEADNA